MATNPMAARCFAGQVLTLFWLNFGKLQMLQQHDARRIANFICRAAMQGFVHITHCHTVMLCQHYNADPEDMR